jgi:hypothetical protein
VQARRAAMGDTMTLESHPGCAVGQGDGGGVEFCFGMEVGLYFRERPAAD